MTRLIDADALLEALAKMGRNYQTQGKILAQMYYVDDITKLVTNAPTVEQDSEPFGIWHVGETEDESDFFLYKDSGDVWEEGDIYLYTSPPKREWRGLSNAEITNIGVACQSLHQVAKAIEAKLKELNHDRE